LRFAIQRWLFAGSRLFIERIQAVLNKAFADALDVGDPNIQRGNDPFIGCACCS
jgi:hypothetical protein